VRRSFLVLIAVLLLCVPCAPASSAEGPPSILISRVCPSYPGEFITIINTGPAQDISGWRLTDGEGSVTFETTFTVPQGGSVSWSDGSGRFEALYPGETSFNCSSTVVVTKGSLKLADSGDELFLFDASGTLVDALYYGGSEPQYPWSGPPVPCRKGMMLSRSTPSVGYDGWEADVPGMYSLCSPWSEAMVTPVLYPDHGLFSLLRQVDLSEESVRLATYIMENWTLARHLVAAASRGVDVTVLLEGQPVGGMTDNGAALAYYLEDSGVNVWVMRSSESFRRYDYLHAKYAVFDEERAMVCSENMADSSFSTNRGWAVTVDSRSLASEAMQLFERDLAGKGVDVFPLELSVARQQGGPGRLMQPVAMTEAVRAQVCLASSPFCYRDLLIDALGSATGRVLVQQMRIEEGWLDDGEVMSSLLEAAERGVQVRAILDAGLGTEDENTRVASDLNARAAINGWNLECRMASSSSPFTRLHNKGVVIDDTVFVGSANWVDGSMLRNRELMAAVRSPQAAQVFAGWFEDDWVGDALPPVIDLPWHYLEVREGDLITLDATGCSDVSGISEISWDVDEDGIADLYGPLHTITLNAGVYNITVKATDALGDQSSDFVTVVVRERDGASLLLYAPLPILIAIVLLRRYRRI